MVVKTLSKQLYLAIMSLMIVVFCITTATYAWFSMNNSVSADGIEISAKTEGINFEITSKVDSSGDPIFTVGQIIDSTTISATSLLPVHPVIESGNLTGWQHAVSDTYDDAKIDTSRNDLSLSKNEIKDSNDIYQYEILYDAGDNYVLHATYYLRLNPNTSADGNSLNNIVAQNVMLTGTDSIKDYSKSTRLVVEGPDGAYEIGPEISTGEGSNKTSGTLITKIEKGNEYRIDVYAFFEGMDENCKSSSFLPVDLGISVDFAEGA